MMDALLSWIIFSPLLGIIVLLFIPKTNDTLAKTIGIIGTIPPLALVLYAWTQFDFQSLQPQFVETVKWITFGTGNLTGTTYTLSYELGVSSLQMLLLVLTAIVATVAAIASIHVKKQLRMYFSLFLLLELGMLGVFASDNLFLFFIFFEITLVPMFFLIGKWGELERERAAFSFVIYNGLGSAVLLLAFLTLYVKTGTANMTELQTIFQLPDESTTISAAFRTGMFLALLIAFGVKLPIFPLHTWMLKVHSQASPAVVMIHSGILLKIGAYGLIRFNVGMFGEEFSRFALLIAILGLINLLYGALIAFIQTDLRLVMAYSSISHMGIVLLGLASLQTAGVQGAIFQVISHGFISALLFFLISILLERTGTTSIPHLGGLAKSMPIFSGFLLTAAMASLGLPGMSGFISELQAFIGVFKAMPTIGYIGIIGIILTAVYLLQATLAVTFGKVRDAWKNAQDMKGWEYIPVLVLLAFIVLIGIYPNVLAQPLETVLETILLGIGG